MRRYSEGSPTASVVIVGEALGENEIKQGRPFAGFSGMELDKMLREVGLDRNRCYLTNVVHARAPFDNFYKKTEANRRGIEMLAGRYPHPLVREGYYELQDELKALEPNVIIACGDVALWAIAGISDDITKWRGSILETGFGKVVCTFNPASIVTDWSRRYIIVQDLRRAARESLSPDVVKPDWQFLIRPTFHQAIEYLESIRGELVAADIETLGGQIECVGFTKDGTNAACIPLMLREPSSNGSYWSEKEEHDITLLLKDVMTRKDTQSIWHNAHFDVQNFAKQYGYVPSNVHDTMVAQHVCFPGLEKSLNFVASLMCDYYTYWKDDRETSDDEERWIYNCTDCCYTFEIFKKLMDSLKAYDLTDQYGFQMELFWPLLDMMLRGTRIDVATKRKLSGNLLVAQRDRIQWLEDVLGHEFNPNSSPQMKALFYNDLKQRPIRHRKTKQLSTDNDALEKIKFRQPLLGPLIETIQELRSIKVFKSTFADAEIDPDSRVRTAFNMTGTETFRLSSSKNVFGTGMNLQNIPKGTEK